MAYSEKSFGQRLAKARQLLELIRSIPDYKASNELLSLRGFESLLSEVELINQQAVEAKLRLSSLREERRVAYHGQEGLISIIRRIRDYVSTLPLGKSSIYYKNIAQECQKMTSSRVVVKANAVMIKEEVGSTRRPSKSEKSFGALLQSAKNVLIQIGMIDDYNPSPDFVNRQKLESSITIIESKNIVVHQEEVKTGVIISTRAKKYSAEKGLSESFQKIKLHIAAAYGKRSSYFLEANRIKV